MKFSRIFVIDGSPNIRGKLCKQISHCGYLAEPFGDIREIGRIWPADTIFFIRDEHSRIADALDYLRLKNRMFPIVAYQELPSARNVVSALRAGAMDYLTIPLLPSDLNRCIEEIAEIWEPIEEQWSGAVDADKKIARLSNRESEILSFLTAGQGANKDIAEKLGLSPRTVEIHRANLFRKLEVKTGIEAVLVSAQSAISASAPITWTVNQKEGQLVFPKIRHVRKRERSQKG